MKRVRNITFVGVSFVLAGCVPLVIGAAAGAGGYA